MAAKDTKRSHEYDMNFIEVFHQAGDYRKDKRTKVTITQHKVDGCAVYQNVVIWHGGDTIYQTSDIPIPYGNSIDSLIEALEKAKAILEGSEIVFLRKGESK